MIIFLNYGMAFLEEQNPSQYGFSSRFFLSLFYLLALLCDMAVMILGRFLPFLLLYIYLLYILRNLYSIYANVAFITFLLVLNEPVELFKHDVPILPIVFVCVFEVSSGSVVHV